MGVSWGEDANPLSIYYLIGLVRRQLRTIVAVALVVGVLSTLLVLRREQQFTSTALLVLDGNASDLTDRNSDRSESQVDTEVEMLRAINIVEHLAVRLKSVSEANGPAPVPGITNIVERVETVITKIVERVATVISPVREPQRPALASAIVKGSEAEGNSSARISSAELLALQRKFTIRRRGLSDVIAIEAKAKTPERAAILANLYAEVYLDEQVTAKLYSIERVEAALAQRIDALRAELAQAGAKITLRELYSDYLSRLKEVRRRRSVIMPDLRLAAPALPLEQLAFPSPRLLLLLSWMLALGLAVGVAFLRDRHFILRLSTGGERQNL